MIITILGCILTSTPVLAQYGNAIQPDVKFDASNDRFDLTAMIEDTNKMFDRNIAPEGKNIESNKEDDKDDDYRRNLKSEEEQNGILEFLSIDKSRKSARRFDDNDFAYHDKMISSEGGTVAEFEENLRHFMNEENLKAASRHGRRMMDYVKYLHGYKEESRRTGSSDNEKDLLMHYAMPFVMDIDGYMKVPLH